MSEHNGLNVAIPKHIVDKGFVEFNGACVYKIMSHPYKLVKTLFPCANYVKSDAYGNFTFKFNQVSWLFG
jgi:hypothetical protein